MDLEQNQPQIPQNLSSNKKKFKWVVYALITSIPIVLVLGIVIGIRLRSKESDQESLISTNGDQEVEQQEDNKTSNQKEDEEQKASVTMLPDTGQTDCFNNVTEITCPKQGKSFFGQDAQYSRNTMSFTDNKDGTVTDNNTGLMWQQDPGEKKNYDEAVLEVKTFKLAGYSDWRLPTIKELYSLMNFNGTDTNPQNENTSALTPFVDTDYFTFEYGDTSTGDRVIDSQWVTSSIYKSTVMNNQECFFGVNFADGRIKCYPTGPGKGFFARYVRGDLYGLNDFEKNNKTITDNATGLMWQREDNGEGVVWEEALRYCGQLSLSGKNDWRLPNAKELQSIVDYSRSPDTTNSPAIDPLFITSSITNEAGEKDYPFYWTSTTHISYPDNGGYAVYVSFGRAMGYMSQFGGWVDVHGAGAQRSDPKNGDPNQYPQGFGPQGDVRRIYNYVRCVRDSE